MKLQTDQIQLKQQQTRRMSQKVSFQLEVAGSKQTCGKKAADFFIAPLIS